MSGFRFLLKFTSMFVLGLTVSQAQTLKKLTLKEAEAIAVKSRPQLQAAELTAAAARQVTAQNRSAFFPNFFASITGAGALDNSRIAAGALSNPIIFDRLATGLTVSQLISDFGRTTSLTESARLRANASEETAKATRAQVILSVDRAYYAVLKSHQVLKVAEETVASRQLMTDQVSELAKSQLKSGLDVSFANVSLSEAKLLLTAAQNEAKGSMADLSAALGYSEQQAFELIDEPLSSLTLPDASQLAHDALQTRPDLVSLRFERDAASKFARAERALSFPTVSAVASVGVLPSHVENLSDRYGAAGFNVNVPVFNGHLFSARHSEAELIAQARLQDQRELENRIARDVRVAWLNANTAFQRVSLTEQLLTQATQALELMQARYDLGLNSIVDLSQAQLNKTAAEIASASAKYEYLIQRAVLDYESGTIR